MQISMFGSLAIHDGNRRLGPGDLGGRKPKLLFERLLLARGHCVSRDALSEALWPERPPQNTRGALDTYVCVLRRHLFGDGARGREVLKTESGAYRLVTDDLVIDLDRFDARVTEAERSPPRSRRRLLEAALEQARGELLEDEPYVPWAADQRDLYHDRVARAHLALARDLLVGREYEAALRHGEDALRIVRYEEEAVRAIMLANHGLGQSDQARRAFVRCRDLLGRDLGVDPTSATVSMAAAIDAGSPIDELLERPPVARHAARGPGHADPSPTWCAPRPRVLTCGSQTRARFSPSASPLPTALHRRT